MAMYLVPRRILDLVERDNITVVKLGHVEVCKDLGLILVQAGGVSQLTRDTSKKGRDSSLTTRRGRTTRGRHCVVKSEQSKGGFAESLPVLTLRLYAY